MFQKIDYGRLNSRQKENYNFHKFAARLAEYGFNSLRLTDDWQGADFIACHNDGATFLKVQLKGRFTLDKKYLGKSIYVAFSNADRMYLYPHDEVVEKVEAAGRKVGSKSWNEGGGYNWPNPPGWAEDMLAPYRL